MNQISTIAGEARRDQTTKAKHPSFLQNLSYYFTEYSDNTSIHGVKFLGERKRSIFEKIWWLIFLAISLSYCVLLIMQTYRKWESSPVLVTFATSETPIWKIPFPAVTICPLFKRTGANMRAKMNKMGLNITYRRSTEYLDLICPKTGWAYESVQATTDDDMINFLMMIQPEFKDIVVICYWVGNKCDNITGNLFKPIITSDGICYSFNMLDRDEMFTHEAIPSYYKTFSIPHQPLSQWSLDKGYINATELKTFPVRTFASGITGGLELVFKTQFSSDRYICQDYSRGYKITLHNPAQTPDLKQRYMRVGLSNDLSAAVKVNMMTTSEELTYYDPKERKCYYTAERRLQFFKVYNQQNCLLECLTNFTYTRCGCVNFYMPRNSSTPICGLAKLWCLKLANEEFLENEVNQEIKYGQNSPKINNNNYGTHNDEGCNCLPSCSSLEFDVELSQTEWLWFNGSSQYGYLNATNSKFARVQIYFKGMQTITLQRNELYGQTDFLASCGGLLGLFTGFSVISVIEILYFITLRVFCNLRKYRKHYWSGAEVILQCKDSY